MADSLYSSLFEFAWRGLSAPCRSFKTSGGQDLAEHKRVDRDGGRQEGTGRNPYVFDVELCFINGLAPGPNESWGDGLFPGRFQSMIGMLEDRSSGDVQHPIFGAINCRPATWEFSLNADERGGVFLHVVFKQSDDTDTATALGTLHAFTDAQVAAGNLDATLGSMTPAFDPSWGLDDGSSFSAAVDGIGSIGDQVGSVSLFQSQALSTITGIQAKCDTIADAFSNTAATFTGQNLLVNAPTTAFFSTDDGGLGRSAVDDNGTTRPVGSAGARVVDAAMNLRASLARIVDQLLVRDKAIGFYTVPRRTTLGALAGRLDMDIDDLLVLNAPLARAPIVPLGTIVRYYS